jgi:TonB family protein
MQGWSQGYTHDKKRLRGKQVHGFLNGTTCAEGEAQVSPLNNRLRRRLWPSMSAPGCNKLPKLLLAAILLLLLTAEFFESLGRSQTSQSPRNSQPRKVTSIKHKKRKRTREHSCPCGIAAEPTPRRYDDSPMVRVSVIINERGRVTSARALSGRKGLQEQAEAMALKMTFQPAIVNGRRYGQDRIITFDFTDDPDSRPSEPSKPKDPPPEAALRPPDLNLFRATRIGSSPKGLLTGPRLL